MATEAIHRPMLPLAVALAAGIATGAWIPGRWIEAGVLAAGSVLVVIRGTTEGRHQVAAPLILIVALGYLSLQPWLTPRLGPGHAARFVDGPPVTVHGTVVSEPRMTAGRQKFVLALFRPKGTRPAGPDRGWIRVTVQGAFPFILRGDVLSFAARLRSLRNFNNPGGFDYRRHLFLQTVRATAYVNADQVQRRVPANGDGSSGGGLARFRRRVAALVGGAADPDSAAVLTALTIGDRRRLTEDLRDVFNRTGVGHLLAISGLHVGIVAALVFWLWARALIWCPFMLERAWTTKAAALGSAAAVWGYSLLAGLSPSTQRAALMVSAYLAALMIERDADLPSTLALAALTILVVHPPALFGISFQLSFAAVAWILIGMHPGPEAGPTRPQGVIARLRGRAAQFFRVSFWAIAGTLPLVMQAFNQISLVGLGANFIFVPWIGMLAAPLALAGTVLALVSAPAAALVFSASAALLAPALALLRVLADWPLSALATFTPRAVEIAIYYAALAAAMAWLRGRHATGAGAAAWRRRVLAGSLVALALLADVLYWGHRRCWHRDLCATVLDVGQGAATVLELPGGAVMLVDGGGFADNAVFDMGQRVVAPFLRYQKISTIDVMVLTHPNADHLNGLLYVLDHFAVGEVWSNHETADTLGYRHFCETIARRRLHWPPFADLSRCRSVGQARVELLYPPPDFQRRIAVQPWRSGNNSSLVLRVSAGGRSILLCGDIQALAESELAAVHGAALESTALLVPHHGSRTSTGATLLEAVRPRAALISCGWRNRYGMPHREVLRRLAQHGVSVWRTDLDGAIRLSFDERHLAVRPFLSRGSTAPGTETRNPKQEQRTMNRLLDRCISGQRLDSCPAAP